MCNCIDDVLEKYKEFHNAQLPSHREVVEVSFKHSGFSLSTGRTVVNLPVVKTEFNSKTGKARNRKSSIAMNYCPFCGEKYDDGENNE